METLEPNPDLIAFCGLYCGACRSFLSGKCPGCRENTKASWCKVRASCLENGYRTCAECKVYQDPMECRKFNNFFSRFFALVFKSNRAACIAMIRETGPEAFARHMAENRLQTIRKS